MEREKYAYEDYSNHLTKLLGILKSQKGTDLHISAGTHAVIRVKEELIPVKTGNFLEKTVRGLIFPKMLIEQIDELYNNSFVTFPFFHSEVGQCQATVYLQPQGMGFSVRLHGVKPYSPEGLNVPEEVINICSQKTGFVVLTGKNDIGMTLFLGSLVGHINKTLNRHIVLIEERKSYTYKPIKSHITHFTKGVQYQTTDAGILGATLIDPDVLILTGIEDDRAIEALFKALELEKLIIAVNFAESAYEAIRKWINLMPESRRDYTRNFLAKKLSLVSWYDREIDSEDKNVYFYYKTLIIDEDERQKIRNDNVNGNYVITAKSSIGVTPKEEVEAPLSPPPLPDEIEESEGPTRIRPRSSMERTQGGVIETKVEEVAVTESLVSSHEDQMFQQIEDEEPVDHGDSIEVTMIQSTVTKTKSDSGISVPSDSQSGITFSKINSPERAEAEDSSNKIANEELEEDTRIKPEENVTQVGGGLNIDQLDKLLEDAKKKKSS